MKPFLLVVLLSLISFASVQAQNFYFERGYIVKEQDTISGFVDHTEEAKLSLSVNFKVDSTSGIHQSYAPGEVSGFGFTKSNLHFRPVEVSLRFPEGRQISTRFAKLLLNSTVSLYQLHLSEEEEPLNYAYVFILQKGNAYHTLSQYNIAIENRVGIDKRYRGTLSALFQDCPTLIPEINQLRYKPEPFVALIKRYNTQCTSNSTIYEYKYKVKPNIYHGPVASLGTHFTPNRNNFLENKIYSIGYFIDFQKPEISRLVSFYSGVSYMQFTSSYKVRRLDALGNWRTETIREHANSIRIPILFQLNFNNGSEKVVRPFLNFGLNGQAIFYKNPDFTEYIPFFNIGTGLYYKNLRLSLQVDSEGFAVESAKIFSVGMGWHLGSKK